MFRNIFYLILISLALMCLSTCASSNQNNNSNNSYKKSMKKSVSVKEEADSVSFAAPEEKEKKLKFEDKEEESIKKESGSGASNQNFKMVSTKHKYKKEIAKSKKQLINKPISDSGLIVYKVPDTMLVRITYTIKIRINRSISDTKSINEIAKGISNPVKDTIKTSSSMEVNLIDPSPEDHKSFLITKLNNDQQSVDLQGYSEWVYSVTPIVSGYKELDLVVSTVENGIPKSKVYQKQCHIKSNAPAQILTFWDKYWEWILGSIGSLLAFFIMLFKNKKSKE